MSGGNTSSPVMQFRSKACNSVSRPQAAPGGAAPETRTRVRAHKESQRNEKARENAEALNFRAFGGLVHLARATDD